jgi:hypothetical protein
MAIYHLSAKVITRGAGHSAVAAAAYRARCELTDERTGLVHDYSRKAGELLFSGIYAPKDSPDWTRDRSQLWNHVEAFEKHRRSELAREFEIALPAELTLEQSRFAVQDFVRDNFTRKGLIADVNIHAPGRDGDQRNIHVHIMVVMRKLDGSEFLRTKERFDTFSEKEAAKKAELENLRESWERIGNRHLERYGHAPTLDRRSLLAQGVKREPTKHMGKSATAVERKGSASELGTVNREIKADNERRVIDLAAERAEREARAAARGQVDDVRPQARAAEPEKSFSRTDSSPQPPPGAFIPPDAMAKLFAREAAGRAEAAPAAVRPGPWNTRATEARSAPWTRTPPPRSADPQKNYSKRDLGRETGKTARATEKTVGKGLGIFGRGIMGALAGLLKLFEIAPAKPPSPEQQERNFYAAQEQQATDELAAKKEAHARQLLERISRDDQERERKRRERGGYDDDYGRGRERD